MISAISGAVYGPTERSSWTKHTLQLQTPCDHVSLSDASPRAQLWRELDAASAVPVPGPLGTVLSDAARRQLEDLVASMYAAGFTIGTRTLREEELRKLDPPARWHSKQQGPLQPFDASAATRTLLDAPGGQVELALSGADVQYGLVDGVKDLRTVEAFYLATPEAAERPALANAIDHISAHGYRFDRGNDDPSVSYSYHVGKYGAYHAATHGSSVQMTKDSDRLSSITLSSEESMLSADFFAFDGPAEPLRAPDLARAIDRLHGDGYAFFAVDKKTGAKNRVWPHPLYLKQLEGEVDSFQIGVLSVPFQAVSRVEDLDGPFIQDLQDARTAAVAERQKSGYSEWKTSSMVAACATPFCGLGFAGQWEALKKLCELDESTTAVHTFDFLKELSRSADDLSALVDEYKTVRERLPAAMATSIFGYLKRGLACELLDPDEYAREKDEVIRLMAASESLEHAVHAREALRIETGTESHDERLEVMLRLLDHERSLTPPADTTSQQRPSPELPAPGWRAVEDYRLLLAYRRPGQSLADAERVLVTLQRAAVPREGWTDNTEAFRFVQRGIERALLHGRTEDEALQTVVSRHITGTPLREACQALLQPPSVMGQAPIERTADVVRIAGIAVPVRR